MKFEKPSGFLVRPAAGPRRLARCDALEEGLTYLVPPIPSIGNCGHERLRILGSAEGVYRCRTIFNCVEACPRDINITRAIGEVKKELMFRKF